MLGRLIRLEERIVLDAAVINSTDQTDSAHDANSATESNHADNLDGQSDQQDSKDSSADNTNSSTVNHNTDTQENTDSSKPEGKSLLLISNEIKDYQKLVDAAVDNVITFVYDSDSDSLDAIIAEIRENTDTVFDSIAIAAHSSRDGTIRLTSSEMLSNSSLDTDSEQQAFFSSLGNLLSSDGRLDLLSCFSAAGDKGQELIAKLSTITGHQVAGSDDLTGAADKGGDWLLETGGIDVGTTYFDQHQLTTFDSVLATETPSTIVTTKLDLVDEFDDLISLREAISYAAAGDTITFDAGLIEETIVLGDSNGDGIVDSSDDVGAAFSVGERPSLIINKSLAINGDINGDNNFDITISGAPTWTDDISNGIIDYSEITSATGTRLFHVYDNASTITVNFNGLKFYQGVSKSAQDTIGQGGAIYNFGEDVTIDNSLFDNNVSNLAGGAISNFSDGANVSSLTVMNSSFTNNVSYSGGAIENSSNLAFTSINNSTFSANVARNRGGAIDSDSGTFLDIDGSTFSDNSVENTGTDNAGGAIYSYGADVNLLNTTFDHNSSNYGGAVYLENLLIAKTYSELVFSDNTANYYGGALYILTANDLTFNNSTFNGNTAISWGGAIKAIASGVYFSNTDFTFNSVSDGDGGAIYAENSTMILYNGTVTENTASITSVGNGNGGGVFLNNSSLDIVGTEFNMNSSNGSGGAIYSNNTSQDITINSATFDQNIASASAGAIYLLGGTAVIDNTVISNSTASNGTGGAYLQDMTSAKILNSKINNNTGNYASGGGLSLVNTGVNMNVYINGTIISGNTINSGAGGGVDILQSYGASNITIANSSIINNTANFGSGGGLYDSGANVTLINTNISNNNSEYGGGIYIAANGDLQAVLSTISQNTATSSASGVYISYGTAKFLSCIIAGNNSDDTEGAGYSIFYSWVGVDSSGTVIDGIDGNVLDNSAEALATLGALSGSIPVITITDTSPAINGEAVYFSNSSADGYFNVGTDYFYYDNGTNYIDLNSNIVTEVETDRITKDANSTLRSEHSTNMGALQIPPQPAASETTEETEPYNELVNLNSDDPTNDGGTDDGQAQDLPGDEAASLNDIANDLLMALLNLDSTGLLTEAGDNADGLQAPEGTEGDMLTNGQNNGNPAEKGQNNPQNGQRQNNNDNPNSLQNTPAGSLTGFNNNVYSKMIIGSGFIIKVTIEGSFASFRILADNSSNPILSKLGAQAASQTIVLSVLSLNTDQTIQTISNLLKQADKLQSFHESYSQEGGGFTAAAITVKEYLRTCQNNLISARAKALEANDLLRIISMNIHDFTDRIAENSFASGVNKVAVANEKLTVEYEVTNSLIKYIQDSTADGKPPTASEVAELMPALRQDALGRAKLINDRSDRASEEVLTMLTKRLQSQKDSANSELQNQVAQMLTDWRSQLGLSSVAQVPVESTPITTSIK